MGATQGGAGGGSCCTRFQGRAKTMGCCRELQPERCPWVSRAYARTARQQDTAEVSHLDQGQALCLSLVELELPGTRELRWVCAQQQGNKMCLVSFCSPPGLGHACVWDWGAGKLPCSKGGRVLPLQVFASQGLPSRHCGLASSRQHKEAWKGSGQFWESHSDAVNRVHFARQSSPPKAGKSWGCAQRGAVQDLLLSCGFGERETAARTQLPSQSDAQPWLQHTWDSKLPQRHLNPS